LNRVWLVASFLLIPFRVFPFLSDSDPQNWVTLTEQAPVVAVGRLAKTQAPSASQRYFIHEIKIEEVLAGEEKEGTAKVLQEMLFPDEKGIFPEGEFLVFLAKLPGYTAYRAAVAQGASYRLFGGGLAVIPLAGDSAASLRSLVKSLADLRAKSSGVERELKRREILFQGLSLPDVRFSNDAAAILESLDLSAEQLKGDEVQTILAVLNADRLKPLSQTALVRLLQKSGDAASVTALKNLAAGPASPKKWAAIQALDALGTPRSTRELIEDFQSADDSQKKKVLGLLVNRPDPEAKAFFQNLLSGTASAAIKKEAIARMGGVKGKVFEGMLLEQTYNRDEAVAAEALLALGRMSSAGGLDRIVQLIDSPSPVLRSAARMALSQSKDPRAAKIFSERVEQKAGQPHGHFD
jgi:HEAT repeat protein